MGARKWVIGGFLAAAVIIVGLGVYAFRAKEEREQAALEASLADALARAESLGVPVYAEHLRGDPIPDEENAWTDLREMHKATSWSDRPQPYLSELSTIQDKDQFLAIADAVLEFWRPFFSTAKSAAEKPSYRPERDWESGVAALMPDLATNKSLVRALVLQARFDLYEGNVEESLARFRTASKIAKHVGSEPLSIAVLVQMASESIIAKEIVLHAGHEYSSEHNVALKDILDGLFESRGIKDRIIAETVVLVESVRMSSSENEAGNELRNSIHPEDRPKILTFWDTSPANAQRFEVMAIEESCDYFEALSDDVGAYEDNDRLYYKLTGLPFEWIVEGFPMSFAILYEQLGGGTDLFETGGPFWQLARRALLGEMYQSAFEIVTGKLSPEDGASWHATILPELEISYSESEEGFELISVVTDRSPAKVKIAWR